MFNAIGRLCSFTSRGFIKFQSFFFYCGSFVFGRPSILNQVWAFVFVYYFLSAGSWRPLDGIYTTGSSLSILMISGPLFHSFSSGCCVGFSRFCCASLKRRLPDSGGSAITFAISLFKLCARRIQTKTKDLWSLGDHLINIFHRSRKFFVGEQVHAQSFNS